MKRINSLTILRITLGIIILAAGLHRIFFFDIAYNNFLGLGIKPLLPALFLAIIVEIVAGILLIANKYVLPSSIVIAITFSIGIIISIINAGKTFLENITELFMLLPTPTNIFLHFTYLMITISIIIAYRKK